MSHENFWKLSKDTSGFVGKEVVAIIARSNTGKTQLTQQLADRYLDVIPLNSDKETTTLEMVKGRE